MGGPFCTCAGGGNRRGAAAKGFWRRLLGAQESLWARITNRGFQVAADLHAEFAIEPLQVKEPALPVQVAEDQALA